MILNNLKLSVVINGREATEFQSPMNLQQYVEGRDGSEFEIVIRNDNPFNIEAVVSVDGLSVIDGEPAGQQSRGYLVNARDEVRIPGWKVNNSEVAKFKFSGKKEGTYSEKMGHGRNNLGVIGVMAFKPKTFTSTYTPYAKGGGMGVLRSRGFGASYSNAASMNAASPSWSDTLMGSTVSAATSGMSASLTSSSVTADSAVTDSFEGVAAQNLGTEFGDAASFNTTEVVFERGDLLSMIELFYDDQKGLKAVGIDVSVRATRPSAFPADSKGCKPPVDWKS